MGGVVWGMLAPDQQVIAAYLLGGAGIAATYLTLGRRLHLDRTAADTTTETEFAPKLTWARNHEWAWPASREERLARRRLWQEENRKAVGRHRHPDERETPEAAVDRAFADVFADAPTATVTPVRPTAVGKATVPQDVEAILAALRAETGLDPAPRAAANDVPTALIPKVPADTEPAR